MINVINYSQIHLDNLTTVLHLDVFEAMNIIQSCWFLGFFGFWTLLRMETLNLFLRGLGCSIW